MYFYCDIIQVEDMLGTVEVVASQKPNRIMADSSEDKLKLHSDSIVYDHIYLFSHYDKYL